MLRKLRSAFHFRILLDHGIFHQDPTSRCSETMPTSPTTKLASPSMHPWQDISKPYTIFLYYDPNWKRRTETEIWALCSSLPLHRILGLPGIFSWVFYHYSQLNCWKYLIPHAFSYVLTTPTCYL